MGAGKASGPNNPVYRKNARTVKGADEKMFA